MATALKKKPPIPAKKPVAKAPVKPVAKKPTVAPAKPATPVAVKSPEKPIDKIAGADHNSPISKAELKRIVDNIEKLEEDKANVAEDIKDGYTFAKSKGFDTKAIREVIKIRKADKEKLKAQKAITDLYLYALDPELADVLS